VNIVVVVGRKKKSFEFGDEVYNDTERQNLATFIFK
jgi:hypothetical protein